jgi:hypothetical protein
MIGLLEGLVRKWVRKIFPAEPYTTKERYPCPFYGMRRDFEGTAFIDSGGNICPFLFPKHSPCPVEMSGKIPDLKECHHPPFYIQGIIKKGNEIRVFPDEFQPPPGEKTGLYEGITLKRWMNYLRGCPRKKIRPQKPS